MMKKTKKAYKLLRIKDGKLYPLYVFANEETIMHEWIPAKSGPITERGKVRSKLGELCYRPGWHLSDVPLATHIGIKENGKVKYMRPDTVWCECSYICDHDFSDQAERNGAINGKFVATKAYLKEIPRNGFYRFKTSPNMLGEWIIAGEIRVERILSDEEVAQICRTAGYEPQPRVA